MGGCHGCEVLPDRRRGERSGQAQGPGERPPRVGEVDAARVGVHGGPTACQEPGRVDDQEAVHADDAQQSGLSHSNPAAHTGALRARETGRFQV